MSNSYGSAPNLSDTHVNRGYGTGTNDFATQGNPALNSSPLAQSQQSGAYSYEGSSVLDDGGAAGLNRSASTASTAVPAATPSRSNTLRKKASMKRTGSLKRSSSRRSLAAGSIRGVGGRGTDEDFNSAFHTPIPTQGSPTEVLANRFQAWRQLLKSLITYFREIQGSYEARAKAAHKVQNTISNIQNPSVFMSEHGLGDATRVLDDFHKRTIAEANKSRDIETDVIGALTGLRSDLGQKIKEIKSLSGDFKNSVEKEKDGTRKEVDKLQEALQHADHEDGNAVGRNDPFVVRLGVDRTIERQIDEENYLHRAYLNLESSGRELESIVVGEIQKAYNALAGILKREADDAYNAVEGLRSGPISMPKDQEWTQFVTNDPHFVDPNIPLRRVEDIEYPGKHHPAAAEVRAGMLERKSKYLKSYTPGWYVLSPTHLHEFKSADKIYTQPPVMSLYLLDQKLGSKSELGSSSHKFMLKGKQSGSSMHKGHNWVFRAETHDTMLAWYEDLRALTESTGAERNAFVRRHARSVSGTNTYSDRGTVSSDGFEDDEADAEPYKADAASLAEANPLPVQERPQRPQPGGRFPSDLNVPRQAPLSPSSGSGSDEQDRDIVAAAGVLPGSAQQEYDRFGQNPYRLDGVPAGTRPTTADSRYYGEQQQQQQPEMSQAPGAAAALTMRGAQPQPQSQAQQAEHLQPNTYAPPTQQATQQPFLGSEAAAAATPAQPLQTGYAQQRPGQLDPLARHASTYGDWMAPATAGAAGVGAGALGADYSRKPRDQAAERNATASVPEPEPTTTTAEPVTVAAVSSEPQTVRELAQQNADSIPTPTTAIPTPPAAADPVETVGVDAVGGRIGSGSGLGGLESEGARETGRFPTVVRHNTDMSISALHVPGEFPKRV